MDHSLEFMIPILEILEIEVFMFPRNLGNLSFSCFSYPGNIGNLSFSFFTILGILEIEVSNIPRILEMGAAGGRLPGLCCAGLIFVWDPVPGIL